MQNSNGRLHYGVSLDNSQLRVDAAESKRLLKDIGQTAKQEGDNIDASMKKIGAAMVGVFAVDKLKDFAMQVANVRGEFQQLEIAFGTMLGSKRAADDLMSQLIRTAAITPFNMSDVANGAKQLLAYGTAADEVNETLTRLGDIAAGLSLPLTDLVFLYGTTMTQGRMFTQDLRQFMGRGIPLAEELAKQFGVTKDKVGELVTAGKVGAEEFKAAIWAMSGEGSKFGGLMEAQSKSITGQISNIEDAIEQMFNEIGKKSEGFISDVLSGVSKAIDNWETIGKVILTVAAAYGTYKAALLAVWAAHKIVAIGQTVVAFLQLARAVTSVKDAMVLLSMVTKASPIGLVVGIVGAAAAAFHLFNTEVSKSAVLSQKFGESAATTITRVNTLTMTLGGLTQGTSTHKQVLDELNGILEEYGLSQIKEGDNIDIVNKKREQAIELIKREAIERQRANNLDAGQQQYEQAIKDAREQLFKDLGEAQTSVLNLSLIDIIGSNSELQENAAAIATIIGDVVQNNISLIAGKTDKEYQDGLNEMYKLIQERMRAIGISEATIAEQWLDDGLFNHQNMVEKFIQSMVAAEDEHTNYRDKVNKAADAERAAAEATMTFSDRVSATQRSLNGASDDVHTLYKNIKDLMSKYSENTIGFTIKFSGQVPAWMKNIPLQEVQRLASYFSSLGNTLAQDNKQGAMVNGQYMTTQQILQRGADYAQEAENRQTAIEKAQREADANKKERERKAKEAARKAEQKRKEQEREAKQIADQTAERNRQIQEYGRAIEKQSEQTELDIRQARADAMQDGFDKDKELIEINYQRLLQENARREQEMLEALAKNKLNEWLNANPKATKTEQTAYYNSLLDKDSPTRLTRSDLTDGQRAQLESYDVISEQIHQKQLHDLYQKLLDDYQDYETRRAAIRTKYQKQREALQGIENADDKTKASLIDGWDKMTAEQRTAAWDAYVAKVNASLTELSKREKEEIKSVNDDEIAAMQKSSTLLVELFTDASDKSDKEIRKLIADTEELLKYLKSTAAEDITPHFGFTAEQLKTMKDSPEQLKAITEKLKQLQEVARKGNPFKTLVSDIKALFSKKKDGEEKESTEARLKKLGASAAECADMVGDLAGKLSDMFEAAGNDSMAQAMSDIQDVMSSVSNIGKGFAQGGIVGGIAAAAGEAIGWISKAFSASARHAAALKGIMKEVTAQQRAYNLALLDESLAMEKAVTVFGNIDYMKARNAVDVMYEAYHNLRKEIEGTAEQQAKFARRETGWAWLDEILNLSYSVLKDAYSGLASIEIKTGHKKTGLFGWGKGKDIYSSILDVYPQLIDGQGKFNTELAKSIIESRTFNGEGKEALLYMIDLAEKAEEAYQNVKDYLTGIFGELGNTMSDALVDAFRNGTDAAEAFVKSVSSMLEKIGEQMIFSAMFGQIIQQANDQMLETMTNLSLTEEQKFNQYIAILDTMTSGILGQQDNYNALMERYQKMAAAKGVSLWQSDDESNRKASEKGIATASQDSVNELNGRMTAVQGHTFSISENTKILVTNTAAILRSVMGIERNTNDLPSRLSSMESDLSSVKRTVNDIALKGIKIKTA